MAAQKITDAEWKVMHVVWKLGRVTGNDVIDVLVPETGWSPNTIRTLLIRLGEKGILHVEKDRGKEKEYLTRYYTPLYTKDECITVHWDSFVERVFDGDATGMLVHFVKENKLKPNQLAELRQLLDQLPEHDSTSEPPKS